MIAVWGSRWRSLGKFLGLSELFPPEKKEIRLSDHELQKAA